MMNIALKNGKLCYDYNQKVNATDRESLILGFYRLRDEALVKVIQHLSEYHEYCCSSALKELNEGKRVDEATDSLSLVHFSMDLCDVCRECDFRSPKVVTKWNER